jgi:CheY-like chemotaxis protein
MRAQPTTRCRLECGLPLMSSSRSRPNVLLVEDTEDDAFFFRYTLKKTGTPCTISHVADGGAAIKHLEAASKGGVATGPLWPDFIFLDLKLPTFSGFEILSWMRQQRFPTMPTVIVLSGSENATDVERAKALGAAEYLVKPITTDQLRDRLARWSELHPTEAADESPAGLSGAR